MRLNHVTLVVTDLERSKAFYRTLGLEQIVDTPPRYARFVCPDGEATVSIEVTGDVPATTTQLFFECESLDETCAALRTKGITFSQEPTDMFYLWREARLRDPDGHDVRLYYAGENRLNPPWRIHTPKSSRKREFPCRPAEPAALCALLDHRAVMRYPADVIQHARAAVDEFSTGSALFLFANDP